jgi:hypothetical protein
MLFHKGKRLSLKKKGLLQATGVAVYCLLVGLFFFNANALLGQTNIFLTQVTILVLLSVSVLICGLLVFYLPYKLFFDKKRKEAADLVLFTTGFLFLYLIAFLLLSYIFRSG